MFFTASLGIIVGGPIALWIVATFAPGIIQVDGVTEVWRGLTTVAGSWMGGTANQTAMKEIFQSRERPIFPLWSQLISL